MKRIIILLVLFSACANSKSINVDPNNGLVLKDAYTQTITGGKESADGKTLSKNYIIAFDEVEGLNINAIWIDKVAYKFETFKQEGITYVSVQQYLNNFENVIEMEMPISSKAKALIMYRVNNENYYFEVDKFEVKESVKGR